MPCVLGWWNWWNITSESPFPAFSTKSSQKRSSMCRFTLGVRQPDLQRAFAESSPSVWRILGMRAAERRAAFNGMLGNIRPHPQRDKNTYIYVIPLYGYCIIDDRNGQITE